MNTEIIISTCSIIGTFLTVSFFMIRLMLRKFDKIDVRFEKIESSLEEIKRDIRGLDRRVSHIEGFLLGKDFRNGTER